MKEHGCKPREYDPSLRNNSHYCAGWKKIWAEYPQRKHEYSCQDCLNKLWQKVNCNLIYLETWASEQVQEIARTKQILEQIKARLDQLTASGQFHNCGIKKCCVEHDRPDHSENEERDLITTGSSEEFPKPKKTTFNRQDLLNSNGKNEN